VRSSNRRCLLRIAIFEAGAGTIVVHRMGSLPARACGLDAAGIAPSAFVVFAAGLWLAASLCLLG
jgi:hypothetical protein